MGSPVQLVEHKPNMQETRVQISPGWVVQCHSSLSPCFLSTYCPLSNKGKKPPPPPPPPPKKKNIIHLLYYLHIGAILFCSYIRSCYTSYVTKQQIVSIHFVSCCHSLSVVCQIIIIIFDAKKSHHLLKNKEGREFWIHWNLWNRSVIVIAFFPHIHYLTMK